MQLLQQLKKKMLNCCVLLDKCYSMESDIDSIDHEFLEQFLRCDSNDEYENFEDLYENINKIKMKKSIFKEKESLRLDKIIAFTYLNIMKMPRNEQMKGLPVPASIFPVFSSIFQKYCKCSL